MKFQNVLHKCFYKYSNIFSIKFENILCKCSLQYSNTFVRNCIYIEFPEFRWLKLCIFVVVSRATSMIVLYVTSLFFSFLFTIHFILMFLEYANKLFIRYIESGIRDAQKLMAA